MLYLSDLPGGRSASGGEQKPGQHNTTQHRNNLNNASVNTDFQESPSPFFNVLDIITINFGQMSIRTDLKSEAICF